MYCFNEAVGILRRKRGAVVVGGAENQVASMRPSEFSDGNRGGDDFAQWNSLRLLQ